MNKQEYLTRLRSKLANIPPEEAENIIRYYSEYFDEAGVENEQRVIDELGSPESLAKRVAADYIIRDYEEEPKKKRSGLSDILIVLAAVFSSPVWFPLGIAAAAVVFALFVAISALIFALAVSCLAVTASSVLIVIFGIIGLFVHFPSGIACIGIGLLAFGTGIFIILFTKFIIIKARDLFMYISGKIIRRGKK